MRTSVPGRAGQEPSAREADVGQKQAEEERHALFIGHLRPALQPDSPKGASIGVVVRMTREDRGRAVELLDEHHVREAVGQGEA